MSAPRPSTGGSGGLWGPLDRHPRRAFSALASVALVLMVVYGVAGGALGARLQSARDEQLSGGVRSHRGPVQFGGDLDPYVHRHGGPVRMSFVGASVTRGVVRDLDQGRLLGGLRAHHRGVSMGGRPTGG